MDSHQDMGNFDSEDITSKEKWSAIRDAIRQYAGLEETEYQELLDEKYKQVLKTYYLLSTRLIPTETEGDWLCSILKDAESNPELATLLSIVDDMTFDELGYNDDSCKVSIDKIRKRTRQRISAISSAFPIQLVTNSPSSEDISQLAKSAGGKRLHDQFVGLLPSICSHMLISKRCLRLGVAGTGLLVAISALVGSIPYTDDLFQFGVNQSADKKMAMSGKEALEVTAISSPHCVKEPVGWIADSLEGNKTAYGETYSTAEDTAAHPFLPPQSEVYLQPKDAQEGDMTKTVMVRIVDKGSVGPSAEGILVSSKAARELHIKEDGIANLAIKRVVISHRNKDLLTKAQTTLLSQFKTECADVIGSTLSLSHSK